MSRIGKQPVQVPAGVKVGVQGQKVTIGGAMGNLTLEAPARVNVKFSEADKSIVVSIADKDKDADLWDIADGLLAGAIQYWLYSRQPCGDARCQDCMPISTATGRMAELKRLMEELAGESEYFHTPTDSNAGRA